MDTKTLTNDPTTFSIEVMPRTAKKVDDFRRILPKKTTVYVAHLEDTPIEEMFFTCKRLISEGMAPMPHIPARIIRNTGELEDWVKEYSSLGVNQSLLLAGNGKTPKGELFNSIQMLETGIFEKHAFTKIQIAGHPEGNRDVDKDGSLKKTINALKKKQKIALLREQGINGHYDMAAALMEAGFEVHDVHMSELLDKIKNFVTPLHLSSKRNYLERMNDNKVECMNIAKKYAYDYWDGDRKYGYGGYKYMPGRWKPLAEKLINDYSLNNNSYVLDVGCGKAFLLFEMKKILPKLTNSR